MSGKLYWYTQDNKKALNLSAFLSCSLLLLVFFWRYKGDQGRYNQDHGTDDITETRQSHSFHTMRLVKQVQRQTDRYNRTKYLHIHPLGFITVIR